MHISLNIAGCGHPLADAGIVLPQLQSGPAVSGDGREGTGMTADAADIWTYAGAPASVSQRAYRLLIDGGESVAPQGAPSVQVPMGTSGRAFQMQLRVQVTAAPGLWSPWQTISAGTVTGLAQLTAPTATPVGETGYTGAVTTDTGNGILYWMVSTSATVPAVSSLKAANSQPITALGQQIVSGAALTAATTYYIHFLQEDAGAHTSAIVSSAPFTTNAPQVSAPGAFAPGDWSVVDLASGGDARLTITALPDDGGAALASIDVRIGTGAWTALPTTGPGSHDLLDLFTDGLATDLRLRASNLVGAGPESVPKFVTTTAAPTVPAAFGAGDWVLSDGGTGGDAVLDVLALPGNGGAALTGFFVRIAGGAPIALGGTGAGPYALDDLFTDGIATSVTILAANAVGQGLESAPKSVTTTSPQAWAISDMGDGYFTLSSAPPPASAPDITNNGDGTFAVHA